MLIECKEHILGDFKIMPNLYENEHKFTVYYQSFIIGTLYSSDTPKMISSGTSSELIFNIMNTGTVVGTVTITCNTIFNIFKTTQIHKISKVSININALEQIRENLVIPRKVIIEKFNAFGIFMQFDPINKKILDAYAKKTINRNYYGFITVDYFEKLR